MFISIITVSIHQQITGTSFPIFPNGQYLNKINMFELQ